MASLHFYVPDYVAIRDELDATYERFGVEEHSAEAGRKAGNPDDADVVVRGEAVKLLDFIAWLEDSSIEYDVIDEED